MRVLDEKKENALTIDVTRHLKDILTGDRLRSILQYDNSLILLLLLEISLFF